jgi:hypothetical protein
VIAGRDGRDGRGCDGTSLGWERAVEARVAGCDQDALEEDFQPEVRVGRPLRAEVGSALYR